MVGWAPLDVILEGCSRIEEQGKTSSAALDVKPRPKCHLIVQLVDSQLGAVLSFFA